MSLRFNLFSKIQIIRQSQLINLNFNFPVETNIIIICENLIIERDLYASVAVELRSDSSMLRNLKLVVAAVVIAPVEEKFGKYFG